MAAHSHHLLYPRALWAAQDVGKDLRHNHWLKIPMVQEVHNQLHRDIPLVPILGYVSLQNVLRVWSPANGSFAQSALDLAHVFEEVTQNSHPIEQRLGQLAADAIKLQIPYLLEGMIYG